MKIVKKELHELSTILLNRRFFVRQDGITARTDAKNISQL